LNEPIELETLDSGLGDWETRGYEPFDLDERGREREREKESKDDVGRWQRTLKPM